MADEKPTQDAAAPAERRTKVIINLEVPVQAHGETLKAMEFRRPTGKDLMQMPVHPVTINWDTGEVIPIPSAMGQVMVMLAAVPPSTIASMDSEDFTACAYALASFFTPSRAKAS